MSISIMCVKPKLSKNNHYANALFYYSINYETGYIRSLKRAVEHCDNTEKALIHLNNVDPTYSFMLMCYYTRKKKYALVNKHFENTRCGKEVQFCKQMFINQYKIEDMIISESIIIKKSIVGHKFALAAQQTPDSALKKKYYELAIESGYYNSCVNLGSLYQEERDYIKMFEYYNLALENIHKIIPTWSWLVYYNIGVYYKDVLRDYDKMIDNFNQILLLNNGNNCMKTIMDTIYQTLPTLHPSTITYSYDGTSFLCPILYETTNHCFTLNKCKHKFSINIFKWVINNKNNCPLCRKNIL